MDPVDQEYFLALLDAPITIHRSFAEICDDLAAAVLTELSARESMQPSDWLAITQDDWIDWLGIGAKQQAAARKHLVEKGFVEERRMGTPPRLHFRLVWPAIDAALKRRAARRVARDQALSR